MQFEDILHEVGGYGRYQRNLTILFLMPSFCLIPWFWLNFVFMVSVPDHWCNVPELSASNLSVSELRRLISPPSDPSCSMYKVNYTAINLNDTISTLFNVSQDIVPCEYGWQYDKTYYESTVATKWDLVCDKDHFPNLLLTLGSAASLIAAPTYGSLADRYGRKIVFISLAILVFATELVSIVVDNFILFAAIRTIKATILPTMFTLPYILITEIVAPNMRAHMNGIINTCWTVGLCISPLIAYLSRKWTTLAIVNSLAALCISFYYFYIPESPSWLISKERYNDATNIMMKIGKTNGMLQDRERIFMQLKTLGSKIKKSKEKEKNEPGSVLLKYPRLRRNFIVLTLCWTAFNVCYSGFTYNALYLDGNDFINFFLLAVVEFPGNLAFWYLMNRCGRRWTATIGFILITIACILPLVGFHFSEIITCMIGKFLITGIFMVSDQQGAELFPTNIRSSGFGFGKAISVGISMFMPYIAYLHTYGKSIPYIFIGLTCLLTGVSSSFLPETLNANLPQTISDAEEFGKDQKFFSWIRKPQAKSPAPETIDEDV